MDTSLAVFDVMILESETDRNFDTGFDFERLAAMLTENTETTANIELTGSSNGFALSLQGNNISFDSVLRNLRKIQNFSILQSARVSTLNGFLSKIDVSEKIPYVSKVELTTLNNSEDLIQSYSFDRASSGLIVTLKPSIIDNLISLDFNCTISNVTNFLEVGTKEQTISQPIYTERNLLNQLIFPPGQTVLVGGLRYQKNNNLRSELLIKPDFGYTSETDKTFTVSVLIRAEIVKYLFI
jgi:type II secretory pathway component GspD/PulD (secretin)